jgi:hypothetical protein
MTPDAATEHWKVYDVTSKARQDAPKITTRICTEYERQAMVRQGQEAGEPQHCMMGAYELMEGKLVSGKGGWQRKGSGLEAYLYYAGSSGDWWVGCCQADMEAGTARGVAFVTSDAMTPDAATEHWKVYDGISEAWQDAPKITHHPHLHRVRAAGDGAPSRGGGDGEGEGDGMKRI